MQSFQYLLAASLLLPHSFVYARPEQGHEDGGTSGSEPQNDLSTVSSVALSPTTVASVSSVTSTPTALFSTTTLSRSTPSGPTTTTTIETSATSTSAGTDLSSSALPSSSSSSVLVTGSYTTTTASVPAASTTASKTASKSTSKHRTLIIALATVFGVVGLTLVLTGLYFSYRYLSGKSPFSHRGATPINDDEIATWRKSGATERTRNSVIAAVEKEHIPAIPEFPSSARDFSHHSGWSWEISSPSASTRSGPQPGLTMPGTPPFIARAPNARTGLTDEAIPGADPFIQPVKRQSSRLSKSQGHARSKSLRSSISARSTKSISSNPPVPVLMGHISSPQQRGGPTWYDPDDELTWQKVQGSSDTQSLTGTSGTLPPNYFPGGLSPRPQNPASQGGRRTIV